MTQDRDDYMRRQEMDHDLLRQRDPNHTQRVGRAARKPFSVGAATTARVLGCGYEDHCCRTPIQCGDMQRCLAPPRTFEFETPKPPPLLTDEERQKLSSIMTGQGMAQGTADMCLHFMMPTLQKLVQRHRDEAYRDGERGGMTRIVNAPGNGDMGG